MPEYAPEEIDAALQAFDRRTFMKLMAASAALAAGCSRPQPLEKIVPYVRAPEHVIPGVPSFYATSLAGSGFASGFGKGALVESHEGRPTKIEGNPDHPSSLGGTDIFMQASILQLYDPDRSKTCRRAGQPITWGTLLGDFRRYFAQKPLTALRVRVLSAEITSPCIATEIERLGKLFPQFRRHVHAVPGSANARRGQQMALGRAVTPVYDFTKVRRVVSFDSHFLAEEPGSVRYAREVAKGRLGTIGTVSPNRTHVSEALPSASAASATVSRHYATQSSPNFTGAMADHLLPARPSLMPWILLALAKRIAGQAGGGDLPAEARAWVNAAGDDLLAHRGESLVMAGEYLPAEAHGVVHGINAALGAAGETVRYVDWLDSDGGSLAELARDMDAGEVDLLVMVDVNPAYASAGDVGFGEALKRFTAREGKRAMHVGGYADETAKLCGWHVPLSHGLEAWGDLRGHDGTAGIVQPLIEPLWESKSAVEVLGALAAVAGEAGGGQGGSMGDVYMGGYERVRAYWAARWKEEGDAMAGEMRWRKSLREGVIEGTAAKAASVGTADLGKLMAALEGVAAAEKGGIEIAFRPDPTVGDGEWANHAWLQELPKPLTRVTWETVALVSAEDARELGLTGTGQAARESVRGVRVTVDGKLVELPAWVMATQPRGVVTLHLGGGRRSAGAVQENVGVDVYPLMRSGNLWSAAGSAVKVEKTARRFVVAATQTQQMMEGRDPARQRRADEPMPAARPREKKASLSLYPAYRYDGYKWGMVIDLSACIGCQACVIACQAENNIPTVGKEQVVRGREMHWLRIDTYMTSGQGPVVSGQKEEAGGPGFIFQPMMCQHCENAPCEVVCPVEATTHSEEGLNEMTYNRCIGTRYCSNNCPYKVRRFNFLEFNNGMPHNVREGSLAGGETSTITLEMQRNPNVTVRTRGVMEKCTYCVQRINRGRIAAKREWGMEAARRETGIEMRTVGAAERAAGVKDLPRIRMQTACQQACPAEAIYFGDLNDAEAVVTGMKRHLFNYGVLTELNTEPRTSYLERVVNPNAAIGGGT